MTQDFSFPHTIRAIDAFVSEYNADKAAVTDQIRHTHKQCMYELLRMWAGQLNGTPRIYRKGLQFRTSHAALATRLGCSKRTAQRYTARLVDAGAIEKDFNGSNTTVTIRFKAGLVQEFPSIYQLPTATEDQAVTKEVTTNSRHIGILNLEESKKQAVEKVARSVWHSSYQHDGVNHAQNRQSGDSRATSSGSMISDQDTPCGAMQDTQGANDRANLEDQAAVNRMEFEAANGNPPWPEILPGNQDINRTGRKDQPPREHLSVADLAKLFSLVARLWTFLESMLSESHSYLSERQQNIGLQYLMHELAQAGPAGLDARYFEMMGALFCVRDYLGGKPGRYVPLPSVYFDKANPHGWEGAKRWYARQERKGDRIAEMKTEFQAQIHLYRAARDAIRPHLRNPYDLETYRKMAQRLGHLDPKLQDAVNALIANGQLLKQAS